MDFISHGWRNLGVRAVMMFQKREGGRQGSRSGIGHYDLDGEKKEEIMDPDVGS